MADPRCYAAPPIDEGTKALRDDQLDWQIPHAIFAGVNIPAKKRTRDHKPDAETEETTNDDDAREGRTSIETTDERRGPH